MSTNETQSVTQLVAGLYKRLFKAQDEVEIFNVTVEPLIAVDAQIADIEAQLDKAATSDSWGAWEPARPTIEAFDRERIKSGPDAGLVQGLILEVSNDNYIVSITWGDGKVTSAINDSIYLLAPDDDVLITRDFTTFKIARRG